MQHSVIKMDLGSMKYSCNSVDDKRPKCKWLQREIALILTKNKCFKGIEENASLTFFGLLLLDTSFYLYMLWLMPYINEVYYQLSFSWWGAITLVLTCLSELKQSDLRWKDMIHSCSGEGGEGGCTYWPHLTESQRGFRAMTCDLSLIPSHVTWSKELIVHKWYFCC